MTLINILVVTAFIFKILFVIFALIGRSSKKKKTNLSITCEFWKSRCEFMFTIIMSILLLLIFNPIRPNWDAMKTKEIQVLFFVFGIILIITAQWKLFFVQSKLFTEIQLIT